MYKVVRRRTELRQAEHLGCAVAARGTGAIINVLTMIARFGVPGTEKRIRMTQGIVRCR